jgi:hypothetical protein
MKKNLTLALSVLVAFNLVACGRMYGGSYKGMISYSMQTMNFPMSEEARITLIQNGNMVTGNFQGSPFSGSITGGMSNGDTITGVMLTLTSSQSGVGVMMGGSSTCIYTGTLTASGGFPNFALSGTFNAQGQQFMGACPMISLPMATKIN